MGTIAIATGTKPTYLIPQLQSKREHNIPGSIWTFAFLLEIIYLKYYTK